MRYAIVVAVFLCLAMSGLDIVTVSAQCPNGREENGPCEPPWVAQELCSPGFECVNEICCKSTNTSETTRTPIPVDECGKWAVRTGSCSKADQRCPAGGSCRAPGICCKRRN